MQPLHVPLRNTPTGVGKTAAESAPAGPARKHPHGRGEDRLAQRLACLLPETPPRAWGRHRLAVAILCSFRNTPTGVGKTECRAVGASCSWKHPHGRGEDASPIGSANPNSETPPRAWGRPRQSTGFGCFSWKHPHGRGEDIVLLAHW